MKILIISDSFKHALSSKEVGLAIKKGIESVMKANIKVIPVSDGGEGFIAAIEDQITGERCKCIVHDPVYKKIKTSYLTIPTLQIAMIEMASASGIELIKGTDRNPLKTTSYGTGELIKHAITKGFRKIILGVGGSATIDAGAGILQALGFQLLDHNGMEIPIGGGHLASIKQINGDNVPDSILETEIIIATDVENPLLGPLGASRIFGPQKGATENQVIQLERNLEYFAIQIEKHSRKTIRNKKGTGAAGGIAVGLHLLPKTSIINGFEYLSSIINLEKEIIKADIIITGEGRMDAQSVYGKVPAGIAHFARKHNKNLIGICGQLGEGHEKLYTLGFSEIMPLQKQIGDLETALKETKERLIKTGKAIGSKLC